ncbi:conserved hypothetical protein [Neospora caninum Liverpool]|nr:conserved hypothetical protein [Neospora caninum Liverpool]CBZ53792.1 conserved hypothetical protein [Neospora caninum Liverpool]|eukprot:XP_003883824.1 conserved hypothetical protein [Neospora caninum Liverpool]
MRADGLQFSRDTTLRSLQTDVLEQDDLAPQTDPQRLDLQAVDRPRESVAGPGRGGIRRNRQEGDLSPGSRGLAFPVGDHLPPSASARLYSALLENDSRLLERKSLHLKELLAEKANLLQQARADLCQHAGTQSNEFREILHLKAALERRREELAEKDARLRELGKENEELSGKLEASRRAALSREEDFKRLERRSEEEFRQSAETRFRLQKECAFFQTELDRLRAAYSELKKRDETMEERKEERDSEMFRLESLLQTTRTDLNVTATRLFEVQDQLRASRQYICYLERLIRELRFFVVYHLEPETLKQSTVAAQRLPPAPAPRALEGPEKGLPQDGGGVDARWNPEALEASGAGRAGGHAEQRRGWPQLAEGSDQEGKKPDVLAHQLTSQVVCSALLPRAASRAREKNAKGDCLSREGDREDGPAHSTDLVLRQASPGDGDWETSRRFFASAEAPLGSDSERSEAARGKDARRPACVGSASGAVPQDLARFQNLKLPELTRKRFELEHLELRLDAGRQAVEAALRDTVGDVTVLEEDRVFPHAAAFLRRGARPYDPRGSGRQADGETGNPLRLNSFDGSCMQFDEDALENFAAFPQRREAAEMGRVAMWSEGGELSGALGGRPGRGLERSHGRSWGVVESCHPLDSEVRPAQARTRREGATKADPALAYLNQLILRAQEDIKGGQRGPSAHLSRPRLSPRDRPGVESPRSLRLKLEASSEPDLFGCEQASSRSAPLSRVCGDASDLGDEALSLTGPFSTDHASRSKLKFRGVGVPPLRVPSGKSGREHETRQFQGVSFAPKAASGIPLRRPPRGVSRNSDSDARGPATTGLSREFPFSQTPSPELGPRLADLDAHLFASSPLLSPRETRPSFRGASDACFGEGRERERDNCAWRNAPSAPPPAIVRKNGEAVLNAEGAAARLAQELRVSPATARTKPLGAPGTRENTPLKPRWKGP